VVAAARFNRPAGLGVLPNGDLVVADFGNHAIRVVTMEEAVTVTTVGGNGTAGFAEAGNADRRGRGRASRTRARRTWASGGGNWWRGAQGGLDPGGGGVAGATGVDGPRGEAGGAEARQGKGKLAALVDYGKLVEDPELADVELVVEGRGSRRTATC